MRLGLSNKITQPNLRGIERIPITLNLTDTWAGQYSLNFLLPFPNPGGAVSGDDRYYNVIFPYHWVKWRRSLFPSDDLPYAVDVLDDPFSEYRDSGDPIRVGLGEGRLPPISKNLDVTININASDIIGGYKYAYAYGLNTYPSLGLYYSDYGNSIDVATSYSSFTEEAAKNLRITINNFGRIGGAGGVGGWGDNIVAVKGTRHYGGGGGTGAGIHRRYVATVGGGAALPVPLNDLNENTISNAPNETGTAIVAAAPGAPGGGVGGVPPANPGTQGSWSSEPFSFPPPDDRDNYDPNHTKGVEGTGGAGASVDDDDEVLRPGAGDGEVGGNAISVYNPLGVTSPGSVAVGAWAIDGTYASDWTSNWSGGGGPELIINNKSGGYIRGGGGGGGGGGTNFSGHKAGGDGGECGESGSVGYGTETGINHPGAAGAGGKAVGTDWPGISLGWDHSAGKITKNNDNTDAHSFYGSDGDF
jgi:hypothetical protein